MASRHLTTAEALASGPLPSDARVAYGPGPRQVGELRLPADEGPHPVAIVVHGGCWSDIADAHYMDRLAGVLVAAGWAAWSVSFRRLGDPGGGWPDTLLDVAAAADYLPRLAESWPIDPARAVTLGHSSGGHLALWLAGRPRIDRASRLHRPDPLSIRAVVSLAGIADLSAFHALSARGCGDGVVRLLGAEPADAPERVRAASPAALLPLGVPQLLVTGEDDEDVPPDHVQGYADLAATAGDEVTHLRVPDAGHFEVLAMDEVLVRFLHAPSGF